MKKSNFLFFLIVFQAHLYAQNDSTAIASEIVKIAPVDVHEESNYEQEFPTTPKNERTETIYKNRQLDEGFKQKYSGNEFDYDRVVEAKESEFKPPINISLGWVKVMMYLILGVIILVVIYFILKNVGGFSFGKPKDKLKYKTLEESEEENFEDIDLNNFELLIQKAKSEGDFRKAVRYYYLWILQKLSDQKLIQWHKDKTDDQYLSELNQNPIREDFFKNTYIYDHIWYGNFNLSQHEFELAEKTFKQTLNKIN